MSGKLDVAMEMPGGSTKRPKKRHSRVVQIVPTVPKVAESGEEEADGSGGSSKEQSTPGAAAAASVHPLVFLTKDFQSSAASLAKPIVLLLWKCNRRGAPFYRVLLINPAGLTLLHGEAFEY